MVQHPRTARVVLDGVAHDVARHGPGTHEVIEKGVLERVLRLLGQDRRRKDYRQDAKEDKYAQTHTLV